MKRQERLLRAAAAVSLPVAGLAGSEVALAAGDALPCGFRWITGLPCPLCGGTHAVNLLLRADVAGAVDSNAGVAVLGLFALLSCALILLDAIHGRAVLASVYRQTLNRAALACATALLVLNWAIALGTPAA